MPVFKCLIEVSSHGILKNSKQILRKFSGQRFIGTSSRAKHAQNYLNALLLREKLKARIDTIDFDVNVKFVFHYPKSVYFTKSGKRSNKVGDLSNLYELPQDCLQKVGILSSDSLIASHDGSHRAPVDGVKYMLEIEITKKDLFFAA